MADKKPSADSIAQNFMNENKIQGSIEPGTELLKSEGQQVLSLQMKDFIL